MAKGEKRPSFTWTFEAGVLTVRHEGKTIVLGRYASHDWAAKAAADYIAARRPPGRAKP